MTLLTLLSSYGASNYVPPDVDGATLIGIPRVVFFSRVVGADDVNVVVSGASNIVFHDGSYLIFHDNSFVVFHDPVQPERLDSKIVVPRTIYSGEADL